MNAATITALSTGVPTIIAAVTAMIYAIKGKRASESANVHALATKGLVESQVYSVNTPAETFPAPPADEPK
jgi:hypothetical protein